MLRARASLLLLLVLPATAAAQEAGTMDGYEVRYGTPVSVSLTDLAQQPESYDRRAVRTHGRLDLSPASVRAYALRDSFGNGVQITPVPEVAGQFESEGPSFMGKDVEITGVFLQRGATDAGTALTGSRLSGSIQFWSYVGPAREPDKNELAKAKPASLEALCSNPGRRDGQLVKVVGKFRGRNLYGDLPARSERSHDDWVIKDDVWAVWITGRKPKGSGFSLDAGLKKDTGKWVEVVGRVETRNSITYVRALQVLLAAPPREAAEVQPPPPPPEKPKEPPVIVFALPLDGDPEVAPDSRFVVQFSKDMDEDSFKGHVLLRYQGPPQPGDRGFEALRLQYDGGRRALTVDPGDPLRPGRSLELVLLPGIADVEGLALVPRTGDALAEAGDVLRFRVAAGI